MQIRSVVAAAAALFATIGFSAAHAATTVINLDATKGTGPFGNETYTGFQSVSLAAGTYTLSVIDNTANGGYNGYNYNTGPLIREAFDFSVNGGSVLSVDVGSNGFTSYASSAAALAAFSSGTFTLYAPDNAGHYDATKISTMVNGTFTLNAPTTLTFGIPDNLFGDNKGGVSLAITAAVPEPETYALMLGGLGVMGFVARRRKSV